MRGKGRDAGRRACWSGRRQPARQSGVLGRLAAGDSVTAHFGRGQSRGAQLDRRRDTNPSTLALARSTHCGSSTINSSGRSAAAWHSSARAAFDTTSGSEPSPFSTPCASVGEREEPALGHRAVRLRRGTADVVVFPDRGPSLVIDSGWRLVADSCLSWMDVLEL